MGQRCSDTRAVNFEDVRVPADQLIGESESGGWMNAMMAFDLSRPNIAAHATGLSEQHTNMRCSTQMRDIPLVNHSTGIQAVQFMLADMKTKIEASRLLTWKAASLCDSGLKNTEAAAHAKRFSADTNYGSYNRCSSGLRWIRILRRISSCKTDARTR